MIDGSNTRTGFLLEIHPGFLGCCEHVEQVMFGSCGVVLFRHADRPGAVWSFPPTSRGGFVGILSQALLVSSWCWD